MVCMFAMVVIQSYIFIPTTDIYFLKFCSSKILPLMEPPNLFSSFGETGGSFGGITLSLLNICLFLSLIRCASPFLLLILDLWTPLTTHFIPPWQAIAPLPKNPFIVVFDGTFGDFVDINERVVLKSVLQLYMELLWMWIFWSLNHYCNDYYRHFYWSIPLMQWMPFFNTSQFIFFWGR